jgi:2-keto-3-deoxygluconate permease
MNILDNVKKIPGGLMIVPMCITALINTFYPSILQIGGPSTGIFTGKGTMTAIGMILVITGSQVKLSDLPKTMKRGGTLCLAKIAIAFASAWLMIHFFGLDGFWGISTVAVVVAMSSCNPGLYIALAQQYGDDVDRANFGPLNIIAVPALPILIMGATVGAGVDYKALIATIAPFILGMVLGNLDTKIRAMMAPCAPVILPFMGFCFGSAINLSRAARAGFSGVLLSVLFLIVNLGVLLAVDRLILRQRGHAAVSISCVAGIAVAIPAMLVASQPSLERYVEAATSQLALAVVLTSMAIPFLTKMLVNNFSGSEVKVKAIAEAAG